MNELRPLLSCAPIAYILLYPGLRCEDYFVASLPADE